MRNIPIIISTLLFLMAGFNFACAENPRIATWRIPIWVLGKDKGLMIEIEKEIEHRIDIDFDIDILPPKRARAQFNEKKYIGIFPSMEITMLENALRSDFYMQKMIYAIFRKDIPAVSSLKDIKGMKAGVVLGASYPPEITENRNITLDYSRNNFIAVKKLAGGRFELILGDLGAVKGAIKEAGFNERMFNFSKSPVSVMDVFFAFQPSQEGKKITEKFSGAIEAMKKDGSLEKILMKAPEAYKHIKK